MHERVIPSVAECDPIKHIANATPGIPAMLEAGEVLPSGDDEMPKYMITYLGGEQPASPEEGKAHMAKYRDWLSSLGDAAVSPANPLKNTSTVGSDGTVTAGGTTGMSGFTVVEVASIDEALTVAKACPFLDVGGSLEVSELLEMSF